MECGASRTPIQLGTSVGPGAQGFRPRPRAASWKPRWVFLQLGATYSNWKEPPVVLDTPSSPTLIRSISSDLDPEPMCKPHERRSGSGTRTTGSGAFSSTQKRRCPVWEPRWKSLLQKASSSCGGSRGSLNLHSPLTRVGYAEETCTMEAVSDRSSERLRLPPLEEGVKLRETDKHRKITDETQVVESHNSGPTTDGIVTGNTCIANLEKGQAQVAHGYTMTQLCDRMIEVFLNEKPQPKDWRKLLVFRDDWKKYSNHFYARCQARADEEHDLSIKQKLLSLFKRLKKVDDEMEKHSKLLKEIQQNPTDLNAVVARRRNDFTEDFFRYLNVLSEVNDSLEERDAMYRLGAKCLCAVSAYDNATNSLGMLESAQSKFDDILNSHSLDAACDKIKSLAKAKELDSSLIVLINRAWAVAKESTTMRREAKDIMDTIYKVTKSCIKDLAPKEIKLLKQLLNITDPEERFSALASAFTPRNEHEVKENAAIYTTPKELHKWIKIMLDAYKLNKEETDMRESRDMASPVVIQRLSVLMETIEEEYLKQHMDSKGVENPL